MNYKKKSYQISAVARTCTNSVSAQWIKTCKTKKITKRIFHKEINNNFSKCSKCSMQLHLIFSSSSLKFKKNVSRTLFHFVLSKLVTMI